MFYVDLKLERRSVQETNNFFRPYVAKFFANSSPHYYLE